MKNTLLPALLQLLELKDGAPTIAASEACGKQIASVDQNQSRRRVDGIPAPTCEVIKHSLRPTSAGVRRELVNNATAGIANCALTTPGTA